MTTPLSTNGTEVVMIVLRLGFWLAQIALICLAGYIACMGFVSLLPAKHAPAQSPVPSLRTYAILIPARNERSVIRESLESLAAQWYPRDHFHVYVAADNCVDDTARIARECGAVVYERTSDDGHTKGYALRLIFERLSQSGLEYDAYVILDADNVAASDFLAELNAAFNAGHHVVQGQRVVKNPDESWVTRLECINHAVTSLEQSGRSRLGLPCRLHGSAMAFSREALRVIGDWPLCLEDATTLQAFCVLHGLHPAWCPQAVVLDEHIASVAGFRGQRRRWRTGQGRTFFAYFGPLLRRGLREADMHSLEQALYLARLQVPLSMLSSSIFIFAVLSLSGGPQGLVIGSLAWIASFLVLSAYVMLATLRGKVSARACLAIPLAPALLVASLGATVGSLLSPDRDWRKTPHGGRQPPDRSDDHKQPDQVH